MKKIMIFMICMLSVVATLESLRSMDSVPANKNILNPALLSSRVQAVEGGYQASVSTLAPIPVDSTRSYTLSFPEAIGSDVSLRLLNGDGTTVYIDERFDEAGGVCGNPSFNFFECTFAPTHEGLLIELNGGDNLAMHLTYLEYDGFQLEEGTLRTDYTPYEPLMDTAPEIVGEEHLHVSYTSGVPLSTILSENIEVHDEIDGVIPTENLTIRSDAYTGHETTVGSYLVTLEATDSSGNTSSFDLFIHVYDMIEPLIEGPAAVEVDVNDALSASAIIDANFTFTDAHDGVIATHTITNDTYTANLGVLGTSSLTFNVTDASGNSSTHTLSVTVKDYDAPVITGDNTLTVHQSDKKTLETLFAMYSASDNYDPGADILFTIDAGGYSADAKSGTYQLTLSASDTSGNASTKTVTLTLIDDVAPELYGLSTARVSYTKTFDVQAYIASMTPSDNDDTTLTHASIVVAANDYIKAVPGHYTYTFTVADASGNQASHTLNLEVHDDVAPAFNTVSSVLVTINDPLTTDNIQTMMMQDESLQAFSPVSYMVVEDDYSQNAETEGTYLYTVEYSNAEGETTQRSIEIQVASIEEEAPSNHYGWIAAFGALTLVTIAVWKVKRK